VKIFRTVFADFNYAYRAEIRLLLNRMSDSKAGALPDNGRNNPGGRRTER
jgi:hypothetical protein